MLGEKSEGWRIRFFGPSTRPREREREGLFIKIELKIEPAGRREKAS